MVWMNTKGPVVQLTKRVIVQVILQEHGKVARFYQSEVEGPEKKLADLAGQAAESGVYVLLNVKDAPDGGVASTGELADYLISGRRHLPDGGGGL